MPTISGQIDDTQTIGITGQTWTVAKSAAVHTFSDNAIFVSGANNTINVLGALRADLGSSMGGPAGIFSQGSNTSITIAKTGFVSGYNGILSYFDGAEIVNHGTILADSQGAIAGIGVELIFGTGSSVANDGMISGRAGLYLSGTDWTATNEKGGQIIGYKAAIDIVSSLGDSVFTNAGTVIGMGTDAFAIRGSNGDDKIINSGTIRGTIALGDGDDTFDFRGGMVDSPIGGGDGNDTLITRKAGVELLEDGNDGFDTVRSSVSYVLGVNVEQLFLLGKKALNGTGSDTENYLVGNAAKNTLKGMGEDDLLSGGKGADTLNGGDGADTFVLAKGSGKDTVVDFEDGIDFIRVTGFGNFNDPGDVEGHIKQKGDDVWVVMSKTDILVLKDVGPSLIDGEDFSFAV